MCFVLMLCYSSKWHISSCDHFPMIPSHVDTSWKSLKFTEKTPNLEEPYPELYNSVWPIICTVGKVFKLETILQKTPKLINFQKHPKNEQILPIHNFCEAYLHVTRDSAFMVPANTSCSGQKYEKYRIRDGLGGYGTILESYNWPLFNPISS